MWQALGYTTTMSRKKKREKLTNVKPKKYRIYGIFNFKTEELISVDMDWDKITLEYDLANYDPNQFDIVSFDVMLV